MIEKRMITSLGIDPSPTATGLVMLRENGTPHPETLWEHEIGTKGLDGMNRTKFIVTEIMTAIHDRKPDKIVVEGYSLNAKNVSSLVPLIELGGLLRFMLQLDGFKWYDPRASEVKKFATGKGNTPKDKVMMFVLKRWAFEAATNNTADAYVMAAMGLAQANRLPGITLDMRKIAGNMAARCN